MNLFIGNLSLETTDKDLRQIFSEFGELVNVRVVRDNDTGMSRGYGFVEMADKFKAFDAIDNIDCTFLQGNIITVKEAKPKTTAGGPGNRTGGPGNRAGSPPPRKFNKRF